MLREGALALAMERTGKPYVDSRSKQKLMQSPSEPQTIPNPRLNQTPDVKHGLVEHREFRNCDFNLVCKSDSGCPLFPAEAASQMFKTTGASWWNTQSVPFAIQVRLCCSFCKGAKSPTSKD